MSKVERPEVEWKRVLCIDADDDVHGSGQATRVGGPADEHGAAGAPGHGLALPFGCERPGGRRYEPSSGPNRASGKHTLMVVDARDRFDGQTCKSAGMGFDVHFQPCRFDGTTEQRKNPFTGQLQHFRRNLPLSKSEVDAVLRVFERAGARPNGAECYLYRSSDGASVEIFATLGDI